MTSYNLSVCLGPCILWTNSANVWEIERASKTVPRIVEFMINNCIEIFGKDILRLLQMTESGLARNTSMSLDSVFTDKPNRYIDTHSMDALTDQLGRQQMSPSRLSYDSGMILEDVSHDEESTNGSKVSEPIHRHFNVSYDSLDCDECVSDEDISEHNTKHNNNKVLYVNTAELSNLVKEHNLDATRRYSEEQALRVPISTDMDNAVFKTNQQLTSVNKR